MKHVWAFGLCLLWAGNVPAADADPDTRYRDLLYELRCLVCQNQSLADSDAELAGDLRDRVREFMDQGMSDEEIIVHLQARYGDFILYRPPLTYSTAALWGGPFLLLFISIWLLVHRVRRVHTRAKTNDLTDEERQRLDEVVRRRDD